MPRTRKMLRPRKGLSRYQQGAVAVMAALVIGLAIVYVRAAGVTGDLNHDGTVNVFDLSILLSDWGTNNATADINGSGSVDVFDLSILLSNWGQTGSTPTPTPPPTATPTPSPAPVAAGCTSGGTVAPCIGGATTGASGWGTPVLDDEFDGSSLTSGRWASSWFNGGKMNNVSTSASNVAVSGGNLVLTLSSTSVGALVDTDPSQVSPGFQFGTGYFVEGRVFFPGSGSTIDNWPAFWTDGQSWPADGEIDIAEGLGMLTSNYHSNSGANNSNTISGTWANGWHTYAVDREAGKNYVYWDGQLVRSYNTDDGGSPHYLIFNVGEGQGPTVTGASGASKMDYVRVWKK